MPIPTLYLLPGFDGSGCFFEALISHLEPAIPCRVITFDDHSSLAGYVEQAESEIDETGAVAILAESFSGPIAIELLARQNRNYEFAVLCTTFARSPLRSLVQFSRLFRLSAILPRSMAAKIAKHYCLESSSEPSLKERLHQVVLEMTRSTLQSRLVALSEMDVTAVLKSVRVPTLLLTASQDRIVGPARTRILLSDIPSVIEQRLVGPHFLLQCEPMECARHIRNHVGA